MFERENKIDFGLIEFDAEKRLCAYREKPTSMYYVSMGIYILQREAVRACMTEGEYLDMPSLLLKMRDAKSDVRCYHDDCMWLDIGRPDDFALAQSMFEQNRDAVPGRHECVRRAIVTGADGFLGRHLVRELAASMACRSPR